MSKKLKLWVAGIALAIIGIVLARVIAATIESLWLQLVMYFLGVILSIAGLGVILYGIRK
ncbi:MAG: hypothetical protein Q8O16_00845 [Dehalococcoidia bacterium]|nr:hypothetical protein [Dehalococcoidia bacterium]